MNARVRNIFIELIGDLDCLFSAFLDIKKHVAESRRGLGPLV